MSHEQSQPYDRALKSLLGDEVAEILPNLLPASEFINEQNIEIDRTTLKADLVYNIGHHLIRLRTILRRSKTLSEQDKREDEYIYSVSIRSYFHQMSLSLPL
jgi:hypothetical protein